MAAVELPFAIAGKTFENFFADMGASASRSNARSHRQRTRQSPRTAAGHALEQRITVAGGPTSALKLANYKLHHEGTQSRPQEDAQRLQSPFSGSSRWTIVRLSRPIVPGSNLLQRRLEPSESA